MNRRSAPRDTDPRGGPLSAPSGGSARRPPGQPTGHRITDEWVEQVLGTVEAIPAGKVLAYGDIAELIGSGGPRSVGHVMSRHGGGVPWWRVIRADGSPPPGKEARARREWIAERTPLRANGNVDMERARWDGRRSGSRQSRGS